MIGLIGDKHWSAVITYRNEKIRLISLGPVDVSLAAALEPVFIRGKAGGERFGGSK
ncbi:hypothetical protein KUC_2468 [Vreelandella boliviensis LC1]|uniref:Uncharacterized protein n=1 Tax=Vreelandella boliviensis LC1 TaxID=1072583 RepID=A0A7U9GG86_9GAMM|nr:hypothetical protein KUC_2468 [Halomonas boliviensis LC1]